MLGVSWPVSSVREMERASQMAPYSLSRDGKASQMTPYIVHYICQSPMGNTVQFWTIPLSGGCWIKTDIDLLVLHTETKSKLNNDMTHMCNMWAFSGQG